MPKVKKTAPIVDHNKGERNLELPELYFNRLMPQWRQPDWLNANVWRAVVANQPFAMICRETIMANILNLDWKIDARDSNRRDELKSEKEYYEKLLLDDGEYDWSSRLEWLLQDYLDIPFGGAAEIGREGDDPDGKVVWIEPLDGATLFPYPNKDWPVGQSLHENTMNIVYFPYYAINRLYMSPRTVITRKGWGCAPPEKIYLSLELLNRGDRYYANLLLDTPEVGILDLGNISEESAQNWVKSWRTMLTGIDPFKIPVLYEHDTEAKFISFTRSPTELMFDKATMKYASICCAGYGMSLSDIGIQAVSSGGETLAGSIRQERKTKRTGFGRAKRSAEAFMNRIIHPDLKFKFTDMDDEVSVALGRARLSSATAIGLLIDKRVLTPQEGRLQIISDGLVDISVPEKIDEKAFDILPEPTSAFGGVANKQGNSLGKPVPASAGGHGETKSEALDRALQIPEFKSVYDALENDWETLSLEDRNNALETVDRFLSEITLEHEV
jgi:hypothetical protein